MIQPEKSTSHHFVPCAAEGNGGIPVGVVEASSKYAEQSPTSAYFVLGPDVGELVEDEKSHPVGKVEEIGAERVMRGAEGIDSERLQLREAPLHGALRRGHS
jgi:hypothetical protein